jgi:hippurate hydrolase
MFCPRDVPGAFAFLGACPTSLDPAAAPANHSNRVVFDESALAYGVAMYTAFAMTAHDLSGSTRRATTTSRAG